MTKSIVDICDLFNGRAYGTFSSLFEENRTILADGQNHDTPTYFAPKKSCTVYEL